MAIAMSILAARQDEPFAATVVLTLVVGIAVTGVILWNRRYRRVWQQRCGRRWPHTEGHFSSGEVIPMVTARTQNPAGFEVWMEYEYKAGKRLQGIYKRSVPTEEAGEIYIKCLTGQSIPVRVAPTRSSVSCVLDPDVDALVNRIVSEHTPET